jgi:hypothetical protein
VATALRALAEAHAQQGTTFGTTPAFSRLTVKAAREQLRALDEHWNGAKAAVALRRPEAGRILAMMDPACLLRGDVGRALAAKDPGDDRLRRQQFQICRQRSVQMRREEVQCTT